MSIFHTSRPVWRINTAYARTTLCSRLTVISFDTRHLDTARIGHHERHVVRQAVHPLRLHAQHVHNQVGRSLRAIDWAVVPALGQVGIMVRMRMSADQQLSLFPLISHISTDDMAKNTALLGSLT